ncbi:RNA ligase (ATP) [Malassezia sp. CBS 17886]|nr:RNA ligase (ATP) [Malassezia sp. CBS 17886]
MAPRAGAGAGERSVDAFVSLLRVAAASATKPLLHSTLYVLPATDDDPTEHALHSWKVQESAYRQFSQDADELPTLARGLFTETVSAGGASGAHERIAARGYDKFFNVGELAWTKPEAIAAHSTGPYVVSHKENGCIIFVAALTPHRLLVTSKHAVGARGGDGERMSHSDMGYQWLQRHLSRAGAVEAQLAAELWQRNETAVMELCDDAFEEHVLPYPASRSGLYVHGLNANEAHFATRPMHDVAEFAARWGFFPVHFVQFSSLAEVDKFAAQVAETGSLHGEPIEGFVVRTQVPKRPLAAAPGVVPPPYRAGQTWFYKIKFDEPYLMYRDWRELTRTMLRDKAKWESRSTDVGDQDQVAARPSCADGTAKEGWAKDAGAQACGANGGEVSGGGDPPTLAVSASSKKEQKRAAKRAQRAAQREDQERAAAERAAGRQPPAPPVPRSRRAETWLYVQWCWDRLYGNATRGVAAAPEMFLGFADGRGIIALRERFLAYLATREGQEQCALASTRGRSAPATRDLQLDERPCSRTLLVPVAVPGCGKTAVGVALARLLGAAHVQSDDVQTKRTGPAFLKNVEAALRSSAVVVADRNNHLLQHRDELVALVRAFSGPQKAHGGARGPRVRLVALAWRIDGVAHASVQHVCASRIVARGERHQCLRVEGDGAPFAYDGILARFLHDLQPFQSILDGEGAAGACDEQFSDTIWVDVDEPLDAALQRILARLCPLLGVPMPAPAAVEDALAAARTYTPSVRKPLPKLHSRTCVDELAVLPTSYVGIFVHADIAAYVARVLDQHALAEPYVSARGTLAAIRAADRAVARPHVTLLHQQDVGADAGRNAQWAALYAAATRAPGERPSVPIVPTTLAWNDRVMALGVRVDVSRFCEGPLLRSLHITVGTTCEDASAYEANALFATGASHVVSLDDAGALPGVLGFHTNAKAGPGVGEQRKEGKGAAGG